MGNRLFETKRFSGIFQNFCLFAEQFQVLDQWLLTDLRDLDYPVLPEGLTQAQKTELNGAFCVQVDSLLDISQPAYGQLQKWRGTDCTNDEVSAVTQTTQRPWEAKSTRMLLLQITDGVQSLEAMEYQPIPALSAALRPGAKLQLQGKMVCRLGVVLLGPSNVKVLGGEVEDLVERNTQGRVLCRTLGLPEEEEQQGDEGTEAPTQPQQGNQEVVDLEMDDDELLASLEEHSEVEGLSVQPSRDSGYGTIRETSTLSSFLGNIVSSGSQPSTYFQRSNLTGTNSTRSAGRTNGEEQRFQNDNMADNEFPDEDFDDFPLDELDSVILQESENVDSSDHTLQDNQRAENSSNVVGAAKPQAAQFEALTSHETYGGSVPSRSTTLKRDHKGCIKGASKPFLSSTDLEPPKEIEIDMNDESRFMDEDMDYLLQEVESNPVLRERSEGLTKISAEERSGRGEPSISGCSLSMISPKTITETSQGKAHSLISTESNANSQAVTLTSAPFTYICLLEKLLSKQLSHPIEIHIKAFIVTLMGKLSSSNGVWSVSASVSDGTGYLDVVLSNEVLTGLLGFSVAEKTTLRRDPARRGELDHGMRRCQEELVDMCCIMTIIVKPGNERALVAKAEPVSDKMLRELELRATEIKCS
ncbi:PREDICTED: recQ-mediated genome instability protein 1 [Cyprinodon variegatus]|uniref:RecQ-mediated genome instability protein 1 n=1 Tax=Cyprinodon variegatus TaxID=28743 RepID=A0A3Q2FK89_CYPVA|nr:PREDICTED: recQ-mediated genome instability protein 1 [Cyprinodon variegatus]